MDQVDLAFADASAENHPLAQALKALFPEIEATDSAADRALIVDCGTKSGAHASADREQVTAALDGAGAVVLFDVGDASYMAGLTGYGCETACAILRNYKGVHIIDVLDSAEHAGEGVPYAQYAEHVGTNELILRTENVRGESVALKEAKSSFAAMSVADRAEAIEEALAADVEYPEIDERLATTQGASSGGLPLSQSRTVYVKVNSVSTLDGEQKYTNEVLMEVQLIASYNPDYKYLQITSLGAGFSPASGGSLFKDGTYSRRFFQNRVTVKMEPEGTALTTLQSSPKNENSEKSVTTSSSYQVGVNIAKNPSFAASYTWGSSETSSVKDFKVIQKSRGLIGEWDYQMGMTAGSMWSLFKTPTLKKGQVKSLPTLSKQNLSPITTIVWYTPSSFDGVVKVNLSWSVDYYKAWVTGNWTKYTKWTQKWPRARSVQTAVDFSRVSA